MHILVQEDVGGKMGNQFKTLMPVRHNSVEATAVAVVASPGALQKCISHKETHTRINMCKSELVACAGEPNPQQNKPEDSETSAALSHACGYQHTLLFGVYKEVRNETKLPR